MANYQEAYKEQVKTVAQKLDYPQPLDEDLMRLNNQSSGQAAKWGASHKVVYTSRTHSQLAQAMKELKVTEYNHLKGVALGSRDQLCINEEVLKEAQTSGEKIHLCRAKVKAKQCSYHGKVERAVESPEVMKQSIMDIEDLVKIGKSCHACPYFMSKTLSGDADIVFLPYNYVLDPKLLKSFSLKLENSIVILDEAHNVEKVCQDAASVKIASSDIATCIEDLTFIMKQLEENEVVDFGEDEAPDFTIDDCAKLKEVMLSLEKVVDDISEVTMKGRTFPGGKILELLAETNITQVNFAAVVQLIDSLLEFLTKATAGKIFARKGFGLVKVNELLGTVYGTMSQDVNGWKQSMERSYRLHIELEEQKPKRGAGTGDGWLSTTHQATINNNAKILNYWCFNPGFGMANLINRNVHSIILTSGTLAPLKPLISELALDVNFQLENPHVIKPTQVLARIISQGPDGTPLNANFNNRDNPKYIKSLGMTVKTVANVTPNGLLVFFPSYTLMKKTHEIWEQTGLWNAINEIKPIFTEPRRKEEFDQCMLDYYAAVGTSRGAIFMAVLRGKVSEGLDFKDQNGRAVIIIGLPFPPFMDPRVVLKKQYLENNRTRENQLQNGQDWYNMEATRAVNQAIGRVIRHKDDYGAILLCDQRFHSYKNGLSRWVQSHIKIKNEAFKFGPVIKELGDFFRNAASTLPKPEMRDLNQEPLTPMWNNVEISQPSQDISKAKFKSQTMRQHVVKIENSNEIYGTSSSRSMDYKEMEKFVKKEEKPTTFLGGLDTNVSTINFNSMETANIASGSNVVSLKNVKQSEDLLNEYESASKKRKLKLAPNAESKEVSFVVIQDAVKVTAENYNKPVPDDRNEFKNLVSFDNFSHLTIIFHRSFHFRSELRFYLITTSIY